MKDNILIGRCLAHGVQIYPIFLNRILSRYELNKIPDDVLNKLPADKLHQYVEGLHLSSMEMAGDWTRGHRILMDIGFVEKVREEGHRRFTSLEYKGEVK